MRGTWTNSPRFAAAIKSYGVDQVFHLAAILGEPPPTQVGSYLKIMCEGTANALEVSRILGVKRVVYASSVAVFVAGPPQHGSMIWS